MNNSGDAAEQVVRLSLEGTEVALKLTGSAAKNIAAAIYILRKIPRRNMRLTAFRSVRKPSLMKPPTSLTSWAAKVFRRPGRTSPRQKSILNSGKLAQNSQMQEQDSTAQTLSSMGR